MDERQRLKAGTSALVTLGVVMVAALGVLVWDYARTKEVTNTAAIVVLVGAAGVFALMQRVLGAEAPRSLMGIELPTGADAPSRRRRRRAYLVEALLSAVALTGLSLAGLVLGDRQALTSALPFAVQGTPGPAALLATEFVALFAVSYAIDRALGEWSSKAVERQYARLDG
ncbi:hypothetical protein GCM10010218_08160 [Streptomyces mashuensis]|uniref:Uncharacterized protein n=1 Tax=Streptomyces mashuensis TaxID=33904 RepID=A0A919AWQ1_9ACTN|nr:hypothetical protein [Streptomyces mashuensis]GHF29373.1 hypothetical protein GCM10010218_08160 [Streptomyces mashuensis]